MRPCTASDPGSCLAGCVRNASVRQRHDEVSMQARAMAAWGGPKASFPQQRLERAMNRWIGQRSTMTADEHMIIASTEFTTAHQVA